MDEPPEIVARMDAHTLCWVDAGQRLHLLWPGLNAERSGDRIYTRSFDFDRRAWSARRTVYQASDELDRPLWQGDAISFVQAENGHALIAFSTFRSEAVFLRQHDNGWDQHRTGWTLRCPMLLRTNPGSLCMAFIGSTVRYNTNSQAGNAVFFSRGLPETFSHLPDPVPLNLSPPDRPDFGLYAATAPTGRIHLMWAIGQGDAPKHDTSMSAFAVVLAPEDLGHAYSNDGGRTWSAPVSIPLPEYLRARFHENLMALPDGTVHLFFEGHNFKEGMPPGSIYHLWWDGQTWRPPQRLTHNLFGMSPAPVVDDQGRLHLLWIQHAWFLPEPGTVGWDTLGTGLFYTTLGEG